MGCGSRQPSLVSDRAPISHGLYVDPSATKQSPERPFLSVTRSSSPSADRPQQSNQSTHARQVDLLMTSVVVLPELKLTDLVWPCATTICWPAAAQLGLSTVRSATGQPRVLVKLTTVMLSGIGPLTEGFVKASCSHPPPRRAPVENAAAST